MKKIIIATASIILFGCNTTSQKEDIDKLQKTFNVVYTIDGLNHICIDSIGNIYHITTTVNGDIKSKIRIANGN